jgi:hypothetical protein
MKQGDYVGWVFGTKNGKEDIISKGTILKKMPDGRYKTLLRSGSVQYFRKRELRVLQSAEEK